MPNQATPSTTTGATTTTWLERLESLQAILLNEEEDYYEQALESCKELFEKHQEEGEEELPDRVQQVLKQIQTKCLLHLGQFEKVLLLGDDDADDDNDSAVTTTKAAATTKAERAYALYKLGKYGEVRRLIGDQFSRSTNNSTSTDDSSSSSNNNKKAADSQKGGGGGVSEGGKEPPTASAAKEEPDAVALQHVFAQTSYRSHETEAAIKMYQQLLSADEEEKEEVMTNQLAAHVANFTWSIPADIHANLDQNNNNNDHKTTTSHQHNYDWIYNAGTLHILGASGISDLRRGRNLLEEAMESCRQELLTDEAPEAEFAKELAVLQTNYDWSLQKWGATSKRAHQLYEQVVRVKSTDHPDDNDEDDSTATDIPPHVKAVVDLNRALLQTSAVVDTSKMTPLQQRAILHNKAVSFILHHKRKEAKISLQVLRKTLQKKLPPACRGDELIWETRLALLESSLNHKDHATTVLNDMLTKLDNEEEAQANIETNSKDGTTNGSSSSSSTSNTRGAIEYAKAMVLLHMASVAIGKLTDMGEVDKLILCTLDNLPPSIRNRRAVVATRVAVLLRQNKGQFNKDDEIFQQLVKEDADIEERLALGKFFLSLGRITRASQLFEEALDEIESLRSSSSSSSSSSSEAFEEGLIKQVAAWNILIQSQLNPEKAQELTEQYLDASEQQDGGEDDGEAADENEAYHGGDVMDAEALEEKGIPRFGSGGRGLRAGAKGTDNEKLKKKDAMLGKRAKKREAYLEKLKEEGRFNPNKGPDPERWIPKSQRSSRRRRGGHRQDKGAQGNVTEREAAKLDVAAGKAGGNKQYSTAHMGVSGGGRSKAGGKRR